MRENRGVDAREPRTLVLSAFPAETDAILAHTVLDRNPLVVADRRHFYLGLIGGTQVIVAMTGIGLVNATATAQAAFARFSVNAIAAVLFSGVAGGGGRPSIADVVIPARWTLDSGTTFRPVDPGMLAAAETLTVADLRKVGRTPRVWVGGDGSSSDANNGQAFPCIPLGGAVFGCQPRSAPDRSLRYQETAAAQAVADTHGVPFLGVRGISDGAGDPLRLPGFPFQFFVYRRVAADNAAWVTAAFLRHWAGA